MEIRPHQQLKCSALPRASRGQRQAPPPAQGIRPPRGQQARARFQIHRSWQVAYPTRKNNEQPFPEHLLWALQHVKHCTCISSLNEQLTQIRGLSPSMEQRCRQGRLYPWSTQCWPLSPPSTPPCEKIPGMGARMWPLCDRKERIEPNHPTKQRAAWDPVHRNGLQMVAKHIQRCPTSLVKKETQIQLVQCPFSPIRLFCKHL